MKGSPLPSPSSILASQFTLRVTVVLWLSEPDVAVTVIVLLPVGVPGFDGPLPPPPPLLPPPHDEITPTINASTLIVIQRAIQSRRARLHSRRGSKPAESTAYRHGLRREGGSSGAADCAFTEPPAMIEGAVVVIVRVEVALPPEGVTDAGDNEQVAAEGAPLHVSDTAELNPPEGATVMV